MKDKQAKAQAPTGSIPVISPVLHCLSMPVLVFLRRGFGYAYLSPKSIFIASIFAVSLMSYIAWHEAALKSRFAALSVFSLAASGLYLTHLIFAIYNEAQRTGVHDQYSGTSNSGFFIPKNQRARFEALTHCIAEPTVTFMAGFLFAENPLGKFLMLAGVSLFLKELIRLWLTTRIKKRITDNIEDAEDMADITISQPEIPLSATGRTGREFYKRQSGSGNQDAS